MPPALVSANISIYHILTVLTTASQGATVARQDLADWRYFENVNNVSVANIQGFCFLQTKKPNKRIAY